MHPYVLYFFLTILALWVYRLLVYFYGKDPKDSKATMRRER
ncbi:hypothetical protein [Chitinophaga caeni]|nr:hypothetical protein [Chitinophaga caeni]